MKEFLCDLSLSFRQTLPTSIIGLHGENITVEHCLYEGVFYSEIKDEDLDVLLSVNYPNDHIQGYEAVTGIVIGDEYLAIKDLALKYPLLHQEVTRVLSELESSFNV